MAGKIQTRFLLCQQKNHGSNIIYTGDGKDQAGEFYKELLICFVSIEEAFCIDS